MNGIRQIQAALLVLLGRDQIVKIQRDTIAALKAGAALRDERIELLREQAGLLKAQAAYLKHRCERAGVDWRVCEDCAECAAKGEETN
jgi:hypothetical protein